jgi:hypothetical protein
VLGLFARLLARTLPMGNGMSVVYNPYPSLIISSLSLTILLVLMALASLGEVLLC